MVRRLIADNRKARFNYAIEDTVEAGLVLTGTEVKALREGRANIAEAYAAPDNGELWLINAHIPEYKSGNRFNHEPRRPRKLLLHKKQLEKLLGLAKQGGMTVVPLKLYFNERGVAKLEIAVARGKKQHDKRQTIKDRDWQRQKQRLMRAKG
ncbi:MAG: SsrA-binding protein SmpB [Minwuiales bacterium]|nr:SsrA-binding protein SmpB [Minwuiales bacterium]